MPSQFRISERTLKPAAEKVQCQVGHSTPVRCCEPATGLLSQTSYKVTHHILALWS
ncbi:hypothetical protein BDW71DRAFT_179160 [Aspergillus fruticulosus]